MNKLFLQKEQDHSTFINSTLKISLYITSFYINLNITLEVECEIGIKFAIFSNRHKI